MERGPNPFNIPVDVRSSRSMLQKLRELLDASRVPYSTFPHPPAFTAQELAAVEHVPGRQHVKVTVVRAGSRYLLAVLPAPKRVDLEALGRLLPEKEARLPPEQEFRDLFPGCEPGAMPPFGGLFGMEVWADRSLEQDETIVFQAGSHTESVRMRWEDFRRLAEPHVAEFAR
jgi:Ala-tRNA(Pro) deacylase